MDRDIFILALSLVGLSAVVASFLFVVALAAINTVSRLTCGEASSVLDHPDVQRLLREGFRRTNGEAPETLPMPRRN